MPAGERSFYEKQKEKASGSFGFQFPLSFRCRVRLRKGEGRKRRKGYDDYHNAGASPTPAPEEINPDAVVKNGNITMVNPYLAEEKAE